MFDHSIDLFKDYPFEDSAFSEAKSDITNQDLLTTKKEREIKSFFNPSKKERTKFFFYSLRKLIRRLVWKDLKVKIFDPVMRNIYFTPADYSMNFNTTAGGANIKSLDTSHSTNQISTKELIGGSNHIETYNQMVTKSLHIDLPSLG